MSAVTPTTGHQRIDEMHPSPPGGSNTFPTSHQGSLPRQSRPGYQGSLMPSRNMSEDTHPPLLPSSNTQDTTIYSHNSPTQGPVLPPFSTISVMGPPAQQSTIPSLRYQNIGIAHPRSVSRNQYVGTKRHAPSSNVTSANSSDLDDEENGELPASGLVAPWEVLRGLADVAIERAAKVSRTFSEVKTHIGTGKWR